MQIFVSCKKVRVSVEMLKFHLHTCCHWFGTIHLWIWNHLAVIQSPAGCLQRIAKLLGSFAQFHGFCHAWIVRFRPGDWSCPTVNFKTINHPKRWIATITRRSDRFWSLILEFCSFECDFNNSSRYTLLSLSISIDVWLSFDRTSSNPCRSIV